MSFVDDYTLTRSSVFRTLLALFIIVTIINLLVFHLVYSDTQAFHRQQLVQRINDDISELKFAASLSHESFQQILSTKQSTLPHFSYRLSEANQFTASVYPLQQFPANNTHVYLGPDYLLEVAVDQTAMDAYRSALVPSIFSGILLPTAAMLGAAFFLTLLVLRRLERVNQAMNRVLCGERQVKLPVSQQHDEFDILAIHLNFMIEQMAKKEAALKSLTTGLAHDMRTPMARLKLRLEDTLTNSQLTNDQQQAISAGNWIL
ncbi:hypothetical protein [Vibrio sp. CAU 1672]|uniref:hypothetical protein n=1 Tax=Vibrio sp. CAU 1672 TaxID=3032594 RepID=UPI0023DBD321|nr:hypothetical protein [Vibrio sp. CAU 1672]MDF2154933.1 hypothetical protein [Vibrio sp. CAU 1672]